MARSAWVLAAVVLVPALAMAQECVPACRSGYFCHEGQCISQCNPPCPAGTTCQSNGECTTQSAAPSAAGPGLRVNQGWGGAAGVVGIVSAVVIAGLVGVTMAFNGDPIANYLGGVAMVFAGVSIPIVAVGAASSRWDPQITGQPALRITGWIAFGLTMADAIVALAIGISGGLFPTWGIASIGLLGIIAAVCHTIDAFSSSSQAEALATTGKVGSRVQQMPILSIVPDGRGGVAGLAGWRVVF